MLVVLVVLKVNSEHVIGQHFIFSSLYNFGFNTTKQGIIGRIHDTFSHIKLDNLCTQNNNITLNFFIEYKRKPVCTNILTKDEHMKYKKWHHANVVAFQAMFKYSLTQYMSV